MLWWLFCRIDHYYLLIFIFQRLFHFYCKNVSSFFFIVRNSFNCIILILKILDKLTIHVNKLVGNIASYARCSRRLGSDEKPKKNIARYFSVDYCWNYSFYSKLHLTRHIPDWGFLLVTHKIQQRNRQIRSTDCHKKCPTNPSWSSHRAGNWLTWAIVVTLFIFEIRETFGTECQHPWMLKMTSWKRTTTSSSTFHEM